MKVFLLVILTVPGLVLLATPALPLGLLMIWLAWWLYERSSLPSSGAFITVVMILGSPQRCRLSKNCGVALPPNF
jgi:hypothetical protein